MKIANYRGRAALIIDESIADVHDISGGRFGPDPMSIYDDWSGFLEFAAGISDGQERLTEGELGCPVPAPRQVFAIGLNYRSHAEESGMTVPSVPATFTKFPASLSGPFDEIEIVNDTVDWEVELVAVIGNRADRIDEADAWSYVAGLTVGQDISDRTLQFAAGSQFSLGKSRRGYGPMGPWLVTPDELPDPDDLALGCSVDGETVQDARTSDLIFNVPRLIAELSAVLPLLPGDIIFTGTPAGVGATRQPPRFLQAGQILETWIEGNWHHPKQVRDGAGVVNVPRYEVDLFTEDVLNDPYPHLRALREAGPLVWLEAHGMFAATRYAEARHILGDHATFVSGEGVALNEVINSLGRGTTLMSDGEQHRLQRTIIGRPLTPRSLSDLRAGAQALADALVGRLVERGCFDAVTELAETLPTTWVPDLLGWPTDGREHLVDWAAAQFDGLGPLNDRAVAASDGILAMSAYAKKLSEIRLPEHCFGARIQRAVDQGEIERSRCPMLFIDYLAPSLDTTIAAIGNAVWLFATHPEQWQLLRREPDRVKAAFNEVLRIESPINCFTRVAKVDTSISGHLVPTGSRVLVSFASANRDERRWDDPDRFDITRESAGHLAFGYGEHACVGMGLARLEGVAVLTALAEQVGTMAFSGPAVRKCNNLIRSFKSLPVMVTA